MIAKIDYGYLCRRDADISVNYLLWAHLLLRLPVSLRH